MRPVVTSTISSSMWPMSSPDRLTTLSRISVEAPSVLRKFMVIATAINTPGTCFACPHTHRRNHGPRKQEGIHEQAEAPGASHRGERGKARDVGEARRCDGVCDRQQAGRRRQEERQRPRPQEGYVAEQARRPQQPRRSQQKLAQQEQRRNACRARSRGPQGRQGEREAPLATPARRDEPAYSVGGERD